MFDVNVFKREVKAWMSMHRGADVQELIDFCEEIIPPPQFFANKWLIDQTVSWYKYLLTKEANDIELTD